VKDGLQPDRQPDMWNAGKGRQHWNYFNECIRKVCNQTLLPLWGCWMNVPACLHLKRVDVFMSRSFKGGFESNVFVRVAWLTRMQNVGALKMIRECSKDAILKCGLLECHYIGTCEMWARAEGTGTALSNPTWRFVARLCHFSVDTECMCQHTCTQRAQVYSQNFPRTQCGSMWFS
jgi:hypothetical protein